MRSKNLIKEFMDTCEQAMKLPKSVRAVEYLDEYFFNGKKRVEKKSGLDIMVTANDSFTEAQQMIGDGLGNVLVLNFANARVPGGGVAAGAMAQEECLCRQSSLYLSLTNKEAIPFYERGERDSYQSEAYGEIREVYSDGCLYSPKVCVFKDAGLNEISTYEVSVITSAAPVHLFNWSALAGYAQEPSERKNMFYKSEEYTEILRRRIFSVLDAAEHFGHKNLVLGAFGCGAFANDPVLVAGLFRECLTFYEFEHVHFAVLPSGVSGRRNLEVFQEVFQKE